MGQQQLLLIVVGIVVVSLGIAGGVHAYGVGKVKSQQDDFALEAMEMAAEVVAWNQRFPASGGNKGRADQSALNLEALGRNATGEVQSFSYVDFSDRRISIDVSNAQRPLIQIHALPLRDRAQSYELAMWGQDDECWAFRVQSYSSGAWTLISGDVDNPDSGTCAW